MEVKEAIEFLLYERGDYKIRVKTKKKTFSEWHESYDKVISLLQQLDKYRQMWEELYDYSIDPELTFKMEQLEQKYFPKEAKQDK